jgi:hypothetical protein
MTPDYGWSRTKPKVPRGPRLPGRTPHPDARAARYLRLVTAICLDQNWPAPLAEHRFNAERRWRFDLAWPGQWVAVEVQGGLFTQGRHTRGAALCREMEKLNDAQIRGWIVLLIQPKDITNGTLTGLLAAYFARWYPVAFPATEDADGRTPAHARPRPAR